MRRFVSLATTALAAMAGAGVAPSEPKAPKVEVGTRLENPYPRKRKGTRIVPYGTKPRYIGFYSAKVPAADPVPLTRQVRRQNERQAAKELDSARRAACLKGIR